MRVSELLTSEEIRTWSRTSDWRAMQVLVVTWASIVAIFAAVAVLTNLFTIAIAIALLGGRQLALAVVVHECGHNIFFSRRSWNRFAGEWLAAAFIFSNMKKYAANHLLHHRHGGTEHDPDLQNYVNYAVTRQSFRRKIVRDIFGITGIKLLPAAAYAYGPKAVAHWALAHFAMFTTFYACGAGSLYLLWPVSWMTSFMVLIRIRNAAEHAVVPDQFDPDPRLHTRTTIPYLWERPFIAPNYVNYHIEHHILASVPCYRLAGFHRLLIEKGHMTNACLVRGYTNVVRALILPPDSPSKPYVMLNSSAERQVTI